MTSLLRHSIIAWLRVTLNKDWTQKLFGPTLINQTAWIKKKLWGRSFWKSWKNLSVIVIASIALLITTSVEKWAHNRAIIRLFWSCFPCFQNILTNLTRKVKTLKLAHFLEIHNSRKKIQKISKTCQIWSNLLASICST